MKNNKQLMKELPLLAILLAPIVYLFVVWDQVPGQLPMHWNLKGEVDRYGPKYLMPLINAGLYLLLLLIPAIDPRRRNYEAFSSTYYKLRMILDLFFSILLAATVGKASGMNIPLDRIVVVGVVLLLTILGNYLGTIKPNWFVGIRVPWTLDSESVWRKTHLMAGRLWFWMGMGLLVLTFLLPGRILNAVLFAAVILMTGVPIVYSYVIFKKEKQAVHRK